MIEIWRNVVKSVDIIPQHPGYRYNYFKSWQDFDECMKETCGEDWQTKPWAKVFLRDELEDTLPTSDRGLGATNNYTWFVYRLVKQGITDVDDIYTTLRDVIVYFPYMSKKFSLRKKTIARLVNDAKRYYQVAKYNYNPQELIQFYAGQGYSLRLIQQKLMEHGVFYSHTQISKKLRKD